MDRDRRQAIEQLFVRYGEGVGSYVLARVGDPELAEEITARVFLVVVRQYHQCRGAEVGWLWSIVRSELGRHFRARRRQTTLEQTVVDSADGPPERLERLESQRRLQAALAELPDDDQQLVSMKFFLQARNRDIAEALGITANALGVRLHRAVKRLRELMEPGERVQGSGFRGQGSRATVEVDP